MKHLIAIALMLVIMGQRWEPHNLAMFNMREDGTTPWTLYYVIGEFKSWNFCQGMGPCGTFTEKFTIPVPEHPSKWMTEAEAEKLNKGLAHGN